MPMDASDDANGQPGPATDPSTLTTKQILRESAWLRLLIETRLNAMDKAIALLQDYANRQPTTSDVGHEVAALRELTDQKFRDTKTALDAAFFSQDRAINKSEETFTKQITALDDKVNDIKDRFTRTEGRSQGGTALWGFIVGGLGLAVAAVTLVVLLVKIVP